jgi:hypothetical protein
MSDQTGGPNPGAQQPGAHDVRAAVLYSRAAFWAASLALLVSAIAVGPSLLGDVASTIRDRTLIGIWVVILATCVFEFASRRRTRPSKTRVVGLAAMGGGALFMAIAQATSVATIEIVSMLVAGVLIVIAVISFWRYRRETR